MSRAAFEPEDTIQFTLVTSIAPDSAPRFRVLNSSETMVVSMTSATSDSTHYYALYTLPTQEQSMVAEWVAPRTFSGSSYNFVKRFAFNISKTRAS